MAKARCSWFRGKEVEQLFKKECLKSRCGNRRCLICVGMQHVRQDWKIPVKELDWMTEQIRKGMIKHHIVTYRGHNKAEFVRQIAD